MSDVLSRYSLVIGFDTEYVSRYRVEEDGEFLDFDPEEAVRQGNRVLCLSYAILNPRTGARRSGLMPFKEGRGHRWTLRALLNQIIKAAFDEGLLERDLVDRAETRRGKRKQRRLQICMVAHFTRADLCGFSDFPDLKKKFSNVRSTYTTTIAPALLDISPLKRLIGVTVTLRDTRLLAPAGYGSLAALSTLQGRKKLSLPDVVDEDGQAVPGITRMDIVQSEHPDLFRAYAIRDAEIAVDHLVAVAEQVNEWDLNSLPITAGTASVALFRETSEDWMAFVGRTKKSETGESLEEAVPVPGIRHNLHMIADCYHGGRNEAYAHGIFTAPEGRVWSDIDLGSAYTAVMAGFRSVDWENIEHTTDIDRAANMDALIFATATFRFPEGTRFPCLPVPIRDGIVFPLEGTTMCTGPELLVARNMGAEIEVLRAIRYDYLSEGEYAFRSFTQRIVETRARYSADGSVLMEKLTKEIGNSAYGKLAQHVSALKTINPDNSKAFDSRTGHLKDKEDSKITCAPLAAMTTGTLRAVLSEILAALPDDSVVLSATTDGFLTDASLAEAEAAATGPATAWFAAALGTVAPGKPILEIKHQSSKVAVMRTRGAASIEEPEGYTGPGILARAGHKLPRWDELATPGEDADTDGGSRAEAAWFVNLFKTRTPESALARRDFISIRDQWMADADLIAIPKQTRVNLDFDFYKRRPVDPEDDEQGLLRFHTKPWRSADESRAIRRAVERHREEGHHVKQLADLRQMAVRVRHIFDVGLPDGPLPRDFVLWMRATVAAETGLGKAMTYRQAADLLKAFGMPTTPAQLKKSASNTKHQGSPKTPAFTAQEVETRDAIRDLISEASTHVLKAAE